MSRLPLLVAALGLMAAPASAAAAPVTVLSRRIEPGSAGFTPAAVRSELPVSLQAVSFGLALLCAAAFRGFVHRGSGEAMENDLWRPIP